MSELFLVRHAQASFGTDDYDRLSELGHRQAGWLGEHFRYRGLSFDRVICGNMTRHHQTAEGIIRGMGLEPVLPDTDPAWDEFDFEAIVGAWLQQNPHEQPAPEASPQTFSRVLRNALLAWAENGLGAQLPEAWDEFEARVQTGLASLTGQPGDGRRILLVSSGGAISMALRQVLEAPAGAMVHMNLQLRNSSVSQLFFNPKNIHFSGFNNVPHLDHPDRGGAVTYY
jgi:broad specificity phosphatase PhoE